MARWEIDSHRVGTKQAAEALASGWEPIALDGGYLTVRRRIPEPLRSCEGCKYRVDTGRRICQKTNRTVLVDNPDTRDHPCRYECHRYPATMLHTEDGYGDEHRPSANGMGCGEWEAANG